MFVSFRMVLCETSMLLFVVRIMFVLIRVFRELDRYGLARVINKVWLFFPRNENLCSPRRTAFERGLTRFCDSLPHQIARNQFFYRVETLYNTIVRCDGVHGIDDNVVNRLREVRDLLSSHSLSFSAHVGERLFFSTGQRGRPKYMLPQEQLEFLVERQFSVPQTSKLS